MKFVNLMDEEAELVKLTRESCNLKRAIDKAKMNTKNYLRSKDLSEYSWELHKTYPGNDHDKWIVKQMEKQIDEFVFKKDMVDSKIVNWLKSNCEF